MQISHLKQRAIFQSRPGVALVIRGRVLMSTPLPAAPRRFVPSEVRTSRSTVPVAISGQPMPKASSLAIQPVVTCLSKQPLEISRSLVLRQETLMKELLSKLRPFRPLPVVQSRSMAQRVMVIHRIQRTLLIPIMTASVLKGMQLFMLKLVVIFQSRVWLPIEAKESIWMMRLRRLLRRVQEMSSSTGQIPVGMTVCR